MAWSKCFLYGDTTVDANQFDGIAKLIDTATASDQVYACGASGATLTLAMLETLIDMIRGQKPDLLLMSRRSRRKINALVRAAGGAHEDPGRSGGRVRADP